MNAKAFRIIHQKRVNVWHQNNYASNTEKIKEQKRQYRATGRHKVAQYKLKKSIQELLAEQDNKCAACKRPREDGETFFVDHDHNCCSTNRDVCGKCVRGLICRGCNSALGFVKDSEETLQKLIEYLQRYKQVGDHV